MRDVNDIIKKSNIFKGLDEQEIQRLSERFESREIHPGDILTNAMEQAYSYFLLEKGTLLLAMDDGKSVVMRSEGDFLGLELVSAKGIYKTTTTVLEKGCVHVVARDDFLEIIQADTPEATMIMTAWQEYLEDVAPFAENDENIML